MSIEIVQKYAGNPIIFLMKNTLQNASPLTNETEYVAWGIFSTKEVFSFFSYQRCYQK